MQSILLILAMLLPEQALLLQRHVEQCTRADVSQGLFGEQFKVFRSTAKRRLAECSRRAGKTTVGARLLLDSADNYPKRGEDDAITAYIGPTKNQAKKLMWGRLQVVAKKFKIPITFKGTELIGFHDNGHQIWIMGANDDRDVERLLGFAFHRVVIDEAQAIAADFGNLIDDVLDPALADHDGDLILMGTPNAACVGYFYDASTGQMLDEDGVEQWERHHWTILDNPMFPLWRDKKNKVEWAKKWLENKRKKQNWSEDHPTFLREWKGQWVRDEGGLVYKYNPDRDHYEDLPKGYHWQFVLGLDLGKGKAPKSVKGVPKGNFAMHAWAFCEDLPDLYSAYQYKRSGLELSAWVEKIKEVREELKPIATVADTGALGEVIVSDIAQRLGIHIEAAEKRQKAAGIELMNSDFASGWLHIKKDSHLAKEMSILQWDEDRVTEDSRFPNDLCDAALYSYRKALHWAWRPQEQLPTPGTKEYYDKMAADLKKARKRKIQRQQRKGRRL